MEPVKLRKQYTTHDGKAFQTVELREPTYKDVFMDGLGEPREWQPVVGGGAAMLVYPERVDQYLQRLVVSPGYEYLHLLDAVDSLRLQRAVCDFFREEPDASTLSMGLSSGSDGTQPASRT